MCAGCMDVISLIHDETYVADTDVGTLIMKSVKQALSELAENESDITDGMIGTFMVVMGGQLLNWEKK